MKNGKWKCTLETVEEGMHRSYSLESDSPDIAVFHCVETVVPGYVIENIAEIVSQLSGHIHGEKVQYDLGLKMLELANEIVEKRDERYRGMKMLED